MRSAELWCISGVLSSGAYEECRAQVHMYMIEFHEAILCLVNVFFRTALSRSGCLSPEEGWGKLEKGATNNIKGQMPEI